MDMEDSAGGARKATKSKLFEFLVHGVRPGMTSGPRMPHQGAPMGPPGPPYGGTPPIRAGMPNSALDPNRKRPAPTPPVQPPPVPNRPRKKPLGFPATNEISARQMDMRDAQSDPSIGCFNFSRRSSVA
ncbi:SWI/SNF-related matrix-associated actin-dependent regulator of chromatin subfamily D member 3-like [Carassius auratus]|uniref:SWI/SNF-related matrix-associated actin-dependent regulator of chromatin subfamily D member 3-like n=1 Tax=Carassius auratus TaxID=7957 RepID=A0A6P6REB6_CARAU|nr:SWI/SNF-related matrix-associated actin-dependent regulator of chromatin subfamily D member 3-like [Carassius auratus]